MSELKAYLCIQAREIENKTFSCYNQTLAVKNAPEATMAQVYLKSEADKVISEKDEEIYNTKYSRDEWAKACNQKDKEIAELKEERRWRKFPEEKPKWGEEVLVVDDESKQYIVRFSHDMKWISWGKMNTCESENVKYWMPLPPAPKEAK